MRSLKAEIAQAMTLACRASLPVGSLTLRANGGAITAAIRDELLAKCAAGEYVELEADLLAYEQATGERNRNFVRFRDGALVGLGRSGKGTPFLRDHNQGDSLSKGGTITASSTEKRDEGSYAIHQSAKLTAPWAVELALRDLLSAVSIGWRPTGPVLCSECNAPVLTKCWHFPGDRLAERDNEDGSKRKVRASDGPLVVEWIFTEAELVETSCVPIGGVPRAQFDSIRAALSAQFPGFSGAEPQEEDMSINPKLLALLGLAATAGDPEVITAVEGMQRDLATRTKELSISDAEVKRLAAEVDGYKATQLAAERDSFIRDGLSSGRISLAEESVWRELHELSPDKAKARMAERKPGQSTPVGQPRQSATVPNETPTGGEPAKVVNDTLAANGIDPKKAREFAGLFGATDPEKSIANAIGVKGG